MGTQHLGNIKLPQVTRAVHRPRQPRLQRRCRILLLREGDLCTTIAREIELPEPVPQRWRILQRLAVDVPTQVLRLAPPPIGLAEGDVEVSAAKRIAFIAGVYDE